MQFSQEKIKEFYYHDSDSEDDGEDDDDNGDDGHSVRGAGKRAMISRNKTRAKKADRHSQTETREKVGDSEAVDMFDVVAGLWAHNARKDMRRARMMKKEQTRESVRNWLQLVPPLPPSPPRK